ncbi:MAG: hypothetical protein F6J93_21120 [Oscillatoria sp. SIO1A7]|nr:hypothetical protein [Oscillatoria sp. SIO1A7]
MKRNALVVGINRYPFFKESPTSKARELEVPAKDAEAIARLLDEPGGELAWSVKRLPEDYPDGKPIVSENVVTQAELATAISELLHPKTSHPPDVALLFFAGHGLRRERGTGTEGFLAASDTRLKTSDEKRSGISLSWLREQLLSSPVKKQIVWLDCCHSGELMNFSAEELEQWLQGGDRFLVAASRDDRPANALKHGVLTEVLLEGLDPERQPEGDWISSYSLDIFIEKQLEKKPMLKTQIPLVRQFGSKIKFWQGRKPSPSRDWQCEKTISEFYDLEPERPLHEKAYTTFVNKIATKTAQYGTKVAFTPNGKYFISVGFEVIELRKLSDGEAVRKLEQRTPMQQGYFTGAAISSKGLLAANKIEQKITIWDLRVGKMLHTFSKNFSFSNVVTSQLDFGGHDSVAFSPDGELLAGSDGNVIRLWNPNTGAELPSLKGHSNKVTSLAFSPDGEMLVSGSYDRSLKLWHPTSRKLLATLNGHNGHKDGVYAVAFSPDGRTIASGSNDKTIKLWHPDNPEPYRTLYEHKSGVFCLAISPDGQTLASGSSDKTIKLWGLDTGELLCSLEEHTRAVTSVAFSPKGKVFASGSRDQTVKIWRSRIG